MAPGQGPSQSARYWLVGLQTNRQDSEEQCFISQRVQTISEQLAQETFHVFVFPAKGRAYWMGCRASLTTSVTGIPRDRSWKAQGSRRQPAVGCANTIAIARAYLTPTFPGRCS